METIVPEFRHPKVSKGLKKGKNQPLGKEAKVDF
jgi:hypothetical protein